MQKFGKDHLVIIAHKYGYFCLHIHYALSMFVFTYNMLYVCTLLKFNYCKCAMILILLNMLIDIL